MTPEIKPFKVCDFDKKLLCSGLCNTTDQGKRFSQLIDSRDFSTYYPVLCDHNDFILLLKHSEIMTMPHIINNSELDTTKRVLENFRDLYRRKIACKLGILNPENKNTKENF